MEPANKVVYGRRARELPLRDAAILQRTLNRLRGGNLAPRGVYRFAGHAEADQWMMRQIAASPAPRNSKTS